MPFFSPKGHDWGNYYQLDGWGVFLVVFTILYTLLLIGLSCILWTWRTHPVIRMRRVPLAIAAVLVLHVYVCIVLLVYPWNGHFPCSVEFWVMSIYLPIGIGLFQASNQQLLRISRGQQSLLTADTYKPLPSGKNRREYYWSAFMIWARAAKDQDDFEGYLAAGMVVQFLGSLLIFLISRQFNSYGIIGHPTTPGLCRRGWEWAPSIIWQAVWNYIAGPYLLYRIRMIRDIYHWRLQTTLAIVAGLPGTPLWIAAVYSDKLGAVNKYWIPAMWLVIPGLMTMQMIALLGPLLQCLSLHRNKKETDQVLADFDNKKATGITDPNASLTTTSSKTRSSRSMRFSMESLSDCLNAGSDFLPFFNWCAQKSFNSENVSFCDKVIKFKREWTRVFAPPNQGYDNSRLIMYRVALNIYLTLIDDNTAHFPINIEDHIKRKLRSLFADAAKVIAARRPSTPRSPNATVTPWDEPPDPFTNPGNDHMLRPLTRNSLDKGSSTTELITELDGPVDLDDPFSDITIPDHFDESCFDAAMASVKHMLWQQPWQDYMRSRRGSAVSAA